MLTLLSSAVCPEIRVRDDPSGTLSPALKDVRVSEKMFFSASRGVVSRVMAASPVMSVSVAVRLLTAALQHRLATLASALCLLALSRWGTTFMQSEFFPASDRPELLVSLTLPANASQTETGQRVASLENALLHNPDIDHFSSYIGQGAIRFYLPMDVLLENENVAQIVVVAKNLAARDRLRSRLTALLARQFSDITTRVSPLELGPPVGWPIKYRVTGPDYVQVRAIAHQLAVRLGDSPLTREVNLTAGEPERVITLQVNQTAARAAGITSQRIAEQLNMLWSGSVVTAVRDNDRLLDVHMIQVKLLTNFTMVAFCRFLQPLQVCTELFFICPGRAVNTLQHFVVTVTAPVRTSDFHQFKMMAETHVRHVGATAHINIFFMMIKPWPIIMADVLIKNSDFVAFTALNKGFARFIPAYFLLDNIVILFSQLMHTLFKLVDIFLSQRVVKINVIVKAIIDHRANRHFGVRPQLFNGVPKQVCARVTNNFHTVIIFGGDDRQSSVMFNDIACIDQLAVYTTGDTGFGKARTNIQRHIHWAHSMIKTTLTTVRKRNYRHSNSLFAVVTHTKDHIQ